MIEFTQFFIGTTEEDEEKFLDELEELCRKYADDDYLFRWEEEDDYIWNREDEPEEE